MAEKTSKKPSENVAMSARGRRIYCTQNAHVEYQKTCIVCGKKFTAKSEKARVCSEKCQYQVKKARKKAAATIGNVTPAQREAINKAGGVQKIASMPLRELTKQEKTLGWLSLGLLGWLAYEDYKAKRKAEKAATKARKEQRKLFEKQIAGIPNSVDKAFRAYGLK